jgi:tetratricopeptide (TPR) repeat protein
MAGNPLPQATFMIAKRITPAKIMRSARQWDRSLKAIFAFVAAVLVSSLAARPAAAQGSALEKGPPPPYTEEAPPPAPTEPAYDPLRADKSVQIGTFYMKRGNYDAAIERFQDATHFQPKLARPYFLLGEAYERKGEVDNALAAYKKYLEVYRTAPDREKILKRIEKLESQSGHTQAKQKSG